MNHDALIRLRAANPGANGAGMPPALQGVVFHIDVNNRNSLQNFICAICLVATDVIRRGEPGGNRVEFARVNALTDGTGAAARRFASTQEKLGQLLEATGENYRVPGTVLSNFCNGMAREMAVEVENMAQRGLLTICYAQSFFTAETRDKKKGKLMAKALLSKYELPVIPAGEQNVEFDGCLWTQGDIDLVRIESDCWFSYVSMWERRGDYWNNLRIEGLVAPQRGQGRNLRQRGEDGRTITRVDEPNRLPDLNEALVEERGRGEGRRVQDDVLDVDDDSDIESEDDDEVGEEATLDDPGQVRRRQRARDRLPLLDRITRTSIKCNTAACLTMMKRWLRRIEDSNERAQREDPGASTTPVFNMAPHANLSESKSVGITATMWSGADPNRVDGILGWALEIVLGERFENRPLPPGIPRLPANNDAQGQAERWHMMPYHRSNGTFTGLTFTKNAPNRGDAQANGPEIFYMTRKTKQLISLKNLGIKKRDYPHFLNLLRQNRLVCIGVDTGRNKLISATAGQSRTLLEQAGAEAAAGAGADADVNVNQAFGRATDARAAPMDIDVDVDQTSPTSQLRPDGTQAADPDVADTFEQAGDQAADPAHPHVHYDMVLVNADMKVYDLSAGHYHESTEANCRIHHAQKLKRDNPPLQDALDELSRNSSKTARPDNAQAYLECKTRHADVLEGLRDRNTARLAFRGHGLRMKTVDTFIRDMINDAKERHAARTGIPIGELEVLIVYGLPTFDSTGRGERAVPTLWLAERIAKMHKEKVLFVNEDNTTKGCPICDQLTTPARMMRTRHPRLTKVDRRLRKAQSTLRRDLRELERELERLPDPDQAPPHLRGKERDKRRKLRAKIDRQRAQANRREQEQREKEDELRQEGIRVVGTYWVNLSSQRKCAFCKELGLAHPVKGRDGSSAYSMIKLGIAVIAGQPRPASFSSIKAVREAGRRMTKVKMLMERTGSPRCRRSIKVKSATPFAGTNLAEWAVGIARGFMTRACNCTKRFDDRLEMEVNYARRSELVWLRNRLATAEARQADIVLRWLLGEPIREDDPNFETLQQLILRPLLLQSSR